jgi:anhydro-N-acetylmuramic acid kinase
MKEYFVIGLMSGTSLDGLDIAYCKFTFEQSWSSEVLAFKTYNYSTDFKEKLRNAPQLNSSCLDSLSEEFGVFMGKKTKEFMADNTVAKTDLIASHGHTVFHQPEKGITLQIGDPKPIYDLINIPVAYDFRTQDVQLGGQGAPLVPFVDALLFSEYDACLNLGGFSNISFDCKGQRVAFDICPVNIVLNIWADKLGFPYDDKGTLARSGHVNEVLLVQLNALAFYKKPLPKSLGWEWVQEFVLPILNNCSLSEVDILRTFTEHCAIQLVAVFSRFALKQVLVSGGGVYNEFLLKRVEELSMVVLKIESSTTESKEAVAFAFLGLFKMKNQINVLSSVTGSVKDHCSGKIYPEEL